MLSTLRKALADTIEAGLQGRARVLSAPPRAIDMPSSGAHVYIQPDPDSYVDAWQSMGTGGRCTVTFEVVVHVKDDNPERRWDELDDLIDPLSSGVNVFGAVMADRTLGITDFQATATPLLSAVRAPTRVSEADGSTTFYELILPVQVMVQRS